jgi:hypothetical protein
LSWRTYSPGIFFKWALIHDTEEKLEKAPEPWYKIELNHLGFSRKGGIMKRLSIFSAMLAAALALGLAFVSCDIGATGNSTAGSGGEIPSDLRNTTWTRQISDSEIVTLCFGRNMMTLTSNLDASEYNQEWIYRGGYCCSYGYCGFYNGPDSLEFRYASNNTRLNIAGSKMRSLNGNWTRK